MTDNRPFRIWFWYNYILRHWHNTKFWFWWKFNRDPGKPVQCPMAGAISSEAYDWALGVFENEGKDSTR